MQEFILAVIRESGWLLFAASATITACVVAVLCAVALNFLGIQGSAGKILKERRSPVATLSMLGFFAGFYLLVHYRVYELPEETTWARSVPVVIGTLLVVAGAVVNIVGRYQLGSNWANQVRLYESQRLVDTGVFALVRHPLYASLLWMFTGASIVYRNPAALAAAYLVFLPMVFFRARQEEAMLRAELPGYTEYAQRVGMFWPVYPGRSRHEEQTVAVNRNGFRFCRWSVAVLLWAAFLLKSPGLIALATAILALNAILGVDRAPLILAWNHTVGRRTASAQEQLYVPAMRFAHTVGTLLGMLTLLLILGGSPLYGWTLLLWFAGFKTAGAMGFCLVSRFYVYAAQHGDCCRLLCGRLKKPPQRNADSSKT